MGPGTRMKKRSPVHFVAGFFQAIASDSQRVRRKPERGGVLAWPMPLQFSASTCMLQNARRVIGPLSARLP